MSTEEKAENICRSIGIAMYVQKEDADMQKENRVGTRKEAGRRKPVKKTEGYAREAGTKAEKRTVKKRTVKKRKDPYMHSLKRAAHFWRAGARTGRDGRGAAVSEALYRSGGRTDDHG